MTERVTIEQNGERFTLEVPDGTSDNDIQSFVAQQQGLGGITTAPPNLVENVAGQIPQVGGAAARELLGGAATANARDALNIAKNATSWTPNSMMEVISHPVETAKAYVGGHPWANTPIKQLASGIGKNIAGAVGQGLMAPENLMTLPYNMAAYEQAKIRMNPTAPEYANNPYAMQLRGEVPNQAPSTMVARQAGPTQNIAGAKNQRSAVRNFSTAGNPNISQIQQYQAAPQQAPAWIQQAMDTYKRYAQVIGQ